MSDLALYLDFDGTLVDSLPGLCATSNELRRRRGLPAVDRDQVRRWIGGGLDVLLTGLTEGEPATAQMRRDFLEHYMGEPLLGSRPYPGVEAMLDRIAAAGVPLALVTNKARPSTLRLLDHLGWRGRFAAVVTPEDAGARKPDPAFMARARAAMPDHGAGAMVGDSEFDVEAGHRAGMVAAAVLWGYRTREELLPAAPHLWFEHPDEMTVAALLGAAEAPA